MYSQWEPHIAYALQVGTGCTQLVESGMANYIANQRAYDAKRQQRVRDQAERETYYEQRQLVFSARLDADTYNCWKVYLLGTGGSMVSYYGAFLRE